MSQENGCGPKATSIPIRRVVLNDASQLPNEYSQTPGGTLFSTTPGGRFNHVFLLIINNIY